MLSNRLSNVERKILKAVLVNIEHKIEMRKELSEDEFLIQSILELPIDSEIEITKLQTELEHLKKLAFEKEASTSELQLANIAEQLAVMHSAKNYNVFDQI